MMENKETEKSAYPIVRLRALEPEDLDLLYKMENDRDLWEVGTTNVPYSRYALHNYIANCSCDIYVDRQLRMIAENVAHETVGIVDLVNFNPQHGRAEVGIVILKRYREQGYAWSALSQLIDYARNILNLHQLYAIVCQDNTASVYLFQSLGFQRQMELKDWLREDDQYKDAWVMQYFFGKKFVKSLEVCK